MSELKTMLERHESEIERLRDTCPHKRLIQRLDSSGVGCGSAYPRIDIICPNCGKKKIIFRDHWEAKTKVVLTFAIQRGFKDQRQDTEIRHLYELEEQK